MGTQIKPGDVVRVLKWGGKHTGTVVRVDGGHVYVAAHGSFVEAEVLASDVEVIPGTPEQAAWRGGVGVLQPGGKWQVEPVRGER